MERLGQYPEHGSSRTGADIMKAVRFSEMISEKIPAEQLCSLALESMPEAWILAESPREVIFRTIGHGLDEALVKACQRVIVFDARQELRMEKAPGATEGALRHIVEGDQGEKPAFARASSYLPRAGVGVKGKLRYVEYFVEDDNGMLVIASSRLAGLYPGENV